MRPNDRRDGSIKVLLILALLAANIALALPRNHHRASAAREAPAHRRAGGALPNQLSP